MLLLIFHSFNGRFLGLFITKIDVRGKMVHKLSKKKNPKPTTWDYALHLNIYFFNFEQLKKFLSRFFLLINKYK